MRWRALAVVVFGVPLVGAYAAAPPALPLAALPADFSAALQDAISTARYKGEVPFEYHCVKDGRNCQSSVELLARVDIKVTRSIEPRDCGAGYTAADHCYRAQVFNAADQNIWEIDLDIRSPSQTPSRVTMTARDLINP